MSRPLIDQFRFTRSEWRRGLEGVSEADGAHQAGNANFNPAADVLATTTVARSLYLPLIVR